MDFYEIKVRKAKDGSFEISPEFLVEYDQKSEDLMIRGNNFYAAYDEETQMWNQNPKFIQKVVDQDLWKKYDELKSDVRYEGAKLVVKTIRDTSTGSWNKFLKYVSDLPDDFHQLDEKVTFQNTEIKKTDYVSKRLPYSLQDGDIHAYEELMNTLYSPEERAKFEWAIGSIIAGDSKKIQKFIVFYGPMGTGKSTVMNLIEDLFGGYNKKKGYCAKINAKALVGSNIGFALEPFARSPLVGIDQDSKLSKIEDNTILNQIVSHDTIQINEKFRNLYDSSTGCFLFMGTNEPVKISDAKSGIIRRLIDVEPTGNIVTPESRYDRLVEEMKYELGAIAKHCLDVYKRMGKSYYSKYRPVKMMYRTDHFFNFMEDKIPIFVQNGGVTANELWAMYKDWCDDSGVDFKKKRFEVIDEAKNYFRNYEKITRVNGKQVRSWFSDLKMEKFQENFEGKEEGEGSNAVASDDGSLDDGNAAVYKVPDWLKLDFCESLFDKEMAECLAQYEITDENGKKRPNYTWEKVQTKLKDIDSTKIHFVKVPGNLIVIDFDLKNKDGEKDPEANLRMAGQLGLPPTYAELSKGGGLHLHYYYDGDVNQLSHMFSEDIEIKIFPEDKLSTLRRKVSRCNAVPIAHISSGLPFKEEKVFNTEAAKDDKHLRNRIMMAIRKEVKPGATVTCVSYIDEELKKAQQAGMAYDIRDLQELVYGLCASSHHHAKECIDKFYDMKFVWPEEETVSVGSPDGDHIPDGTTEFWDENSPRIILDVECWPNLFMVVYKEVEPDGVAAILKPPGEAQKQCVVMYNPKPYEIERLFGAKIIGFNNISYDNPMLYGCYLGNTNEEQHALSRSIIKFNQKSYRESKNISYTDVYDFSSEKKSLKKFEIEMHLPHKEMETDWDAPLPEDQWIKAAEYCKNDVLATEAVFLSKDRQADFEAREILADITGMTVNDSTNNLTAQLIFGDDWNPQEQFNYPNLHELFPEYRFENGKSYFNDEIIGEGGRVFAIPGMYYNVTTYDVSGMHPSSIIAEQGFGPLYTKRYEDLYLARIAIKHKDYEAAGKMFDGKLAKYLTDKKNAKALSRALKIALNSVYGMTAAHFKNRFRDERNIDNWVAKRGACFIEKLRLEVEKRISEWGLKSKVIHLKTDSIKIVDTTPELQDFIMEFGKKYGYTFEIESHYERMCLVNKAVYIALRDKDDPSWTEECDKARDAANESDSEYIEPTRWTATGAQFDHPYVFKKLFSKEKFSFWDYCEVKTVQTAMYLDMNENLPNVEGLEKDLDKLNKRIKKLQQEYDRIDISEEDREKIKAELEDLPKDREILEEEIAKGHNYLFVGKAGSFVPIKPGLGGGLLVRLGANGKYDAVGGSKGFRWVESETLEHIPEAKQMIDMNYFKELIDTAIDTIEAFGDFQMFVAGEDHILTPEDRVLDINIDPWMLPCGTEEYENCSDCPNFSCENYGYCCKLGYNIENVIMTD